MIYSIAALDNCFVFSSNEGHNYLINIRRSEVASINLVTGTDSLQVSFDFCEINV